MDNYKYKLQYVCDNKTVTHEFNANITTDDLTYNLRDFLCGCSWREKAVNEMLRLEDDYEACNNN